VVASQPNSARTTAAASAVVVGASGRWY